MSFVGYIVDTNVLAEIPPGVLWHAESPPGGTQSLVAIDWHGSENSGAAFDARPDAIQLVPWEAAPAEAATFLSSLQVSAASKSTSVSTSVVDVPATPETVATVLRKLDSPVARLIR